MPGLENPQGTGLQAGLQLETVVSVMAILQQLSNVGRRIRP